MLQNNLSRLREQFTTLDANRGFPYPPAAMRFRRAVLILLFALTAYPASRRAAAEPLQLSPIDGVVLLRNGQVLSGKIARAGDYYYVSLPRGEIRLKANEVEKVARRVEELYEEKQARLRPGELRDHLDLAEWCVEQKLVEQGSRQLALAMSLDPRHPRIGLIQRRLELAQRRDVEPAPARHPADSGPSNEELDRLVRGLPSHAVETFTSTVQPLLVNTCTTSGCHGPRSQGKLRLFRLSLGEPVNRRRTQRNLYAVWQVVDADRPAESPLLRQPTRPHGKLRGPIFSGREASQYRQLVAWVYDATRQRKPAEPKDDEQSPPEPVAGSQGRAKKKSEANKPTASKPDAEITLTSAVEELEGDSEEPPEPEAARHRSMTNSEYVPVDPFDPEIFNRRYLGKTLNPEP
ncbi:MAG: hypothetical protein B7Z73_06030 [Planctomycetia bacterium 21-64-5]|nr:MAG: hypothetical protein B7Z73_06030 [Planctomycetia bacterium 21-64-5]HQU43009.1 hypothetical protein [Pirellulales bacterium]